MLRSYRGSTIPSSLQPIMPCLAYCLLQGITSLSFTRGSFSRGLKIARLNKRNVSGKVTLLPGTELRPVSFNKRQQTEEAFFQKHSWSVHVAPILKILGNIVSSVSFCFQDANYTHAARQGILTQNPSMRAVAKILRARASEHSSNFCEQFAQRQNFASTFKLNGTIRYPSL